MKALKCCFPIRSFITLAENFGKWRPYLELFWGPEILLGAAAPCALGTAPVSKSHTIRPGTNFLAYDYTFSTMMT